MNPIISWMGSRRQLLAWGAALSAEQAIGQTWPDRSIRWVVPFPAGSGTDVAARVVAQSVSIAVGQPVVIDNKPGAGGSIAAMEVVRAMPDGHTFLFASSSTLAANVSLLKSMPYDPIKDLTPVAGIADSVTALVVRSNFPAQNLAEFINHVRQRPGKLNASYGSSSTQIALAVLSAVADLDVTAVPYKGTPLAVQDLLAGNVDFAFADLGNLMAYVRSGQLRGLGVTSPKRSPMVDWPPIAETYANYDDITGWIGLAGPVGLSRDITSKLGRLVQKALGSPEVRSKLATFGLSPMPMGPEQLRAFMITEVQKWARLAKAAHIQPE
jgi:tripartite-type tricarboxylate transporter receptor subunit TctC